MANVDPERWGHRFLTFRFGVVDDTGQDLPPDEVGNIQVRGPNVFVGYWQLPDKTAEDFTDDGFFDTGDKGKISDDGYTSIVGRAKDIVITGGLNVYPRKSSCSSTTWEVSKSQQLSACRTPILARLSLQSFVRDSPKALLMPMGIIQLAKESLANFKIPKHVVFLDELPRNSMAKVQKNVLRERYDDLFHSC